MSVKSIAWATTSTSLVGADPGILVQSTDTESGPELGTEVWSDERDCITEDGDVDYDALDALLAEMGYERVWGENWVNSGDQWAAHVEAIA
ncbi:MAG: hypothetical protein NVSMB4_08780 [Acidimicrobiales bacterium]